MIDVMWIIFGLSFLVAPILMVTSGISKKCPICKKTVWQYLDGDTYFDDATNKIEYHARCILTNNELGIKETINVIHCHAKLEDGTFCNNPPTMRHCVAPQCKKHYDEDSKFLQSLGVTECNGVKLIASHNSNKVNKK